MHGCVRVRTKIKGSHMLVLHTFNESTNSSAQGYTDKEASTSHTQMVCVALVNSLTAGIDPEPVESFFAIAVLKVGRKDFYTRVSHYPMKEGQQGPTSPLTFRSLDELLHALARHEDAGRHLRPVVSVCAAYLGRFFKLLQDFCDSRSVQTIKKSQQRRTAQELKWLTSCSS